jgi:soluble lytic murein transglycosylase-like protein
MMKRIATFIAALGLLLAVASPARAEVWGYVDDKGVAHFAAEKVDERYELFFRGGESFDTANGLATPRPVAVPSAAASKLIAFFEISPGYKQVQHHLRAASKANGIDFELLKAVIATESGFDASAVSPRGAIGLMQVMPATAQRYGAPGDRKKLADPGVNIRTGSKYLHDLIGMFRGNIELALAAYNAGEGAVIKAGNKVPAYRETQNYVKTVMQLYEMLKPPSSLRSAGRIKMEIPATPNGGAVGRGNLPAGQARTKQEEPEDS